MDIRTLGVVVTGGAGDAVALAAASDLAALWGARIDAVALAVEPVMVDASSMGAVALVVEAHEEALSEAEATARAARTALPPNASVEPMALAHPGLREPLGRRLRLADLVVAARPLGARRGGAALAAVEAALFEARVPVLVVPDAGADLGRPIERAVVAWDDGVPALAAARSALPVLTGAKSVDVVAVDPGDPRSAEALTLWLARHDVRAETLEVPRTEATVATTLARIAREREAGVMVLGAFGHSRLREAVFGGVTRDLLASVPLPLWLAR